MIKITIEFKGYWTDENKTSIPNKSGIYCVHRGMDNGTTVDLRELLYIGESGQVCDRVSSHKKRDSWISNLGYGETLIYSFGGIVFNRERAEAALIYHHKPPTNVEYKDSFTFEDTEISLSGKTNLLTEYFVVRKDKGLQGLFGRLQYS